MKMGMKKILTIVLVLAFVSASYADSSGFYSGGSATVTADPGDVIQVDLIADFDIDRVQIASILDSASAAGIASGVSYDAGFDWAMFTSIGPLNTGGSLVQLVNLAVDRLGGSPKIPANTVLFSFNYQVGSPLPLTVGADLGLTTSVGGTKPADLNVIPEPMTVVLLGLGGLFLRRRK
jgi:hypothetical protein